MARKLNMRACPIGPGTAFEEPAASIDHIYKPVLLESESKQRHPAARCRSGSYPPELALKQRGGFGARQFRRQT